MLSSQISNTPVIKGQLRSLLARFGIEVNLYHKTATDYDSVYGLYGGVNIETQTDPTIIKILCPINLNSPVDDLFTSGFDSVFNYSLDDIINGDVIEFIRVDATVLKFKVVGLVSFGLEQKIAVKFRMTPLGGDV